MSYCSLKIAIAALVVALPGSCYGQTQQQKSTVRTAQPKQATGQNPQQSQCATDITRLTEYNKRLQELLSGFSEQSDKQIADEHAKAEACARDVAIASNPSAPGSDTDLRLENVRLRGQVAALQQENQRLVAQSTAQTTASLPCAAVKTAAKTGESLRIRAMVITEADAAQLRKRGATDPTGIPIKIEQLRTTGKFCLRLAGDFVLVLEGDGSLNSQDGRPEVVFEPKASIGFQDLAPFMIPSDRCADVADELRSSGLLGKIADENLSIWAQRDDRLVMCKEDRTAALDGMWDIAAGKPDGRAALLVLRFEVRADQ